VEEICKEALQWAYDPSVRMPVKTITSGIEKVRVPLDFPAFMKSFYFWKMLTKKENLPLPPMKRILPMHHSFWNVTKHGSDVKTKYIQSMKTTIPNNNLGAKAFDRMQMIIFSEMHRGSVIYMEGKNKNRLNSCKSLENFRMRTKKQMTFRQALNSINNIIRDKIENIAHERQLEDDVLISSIGAESKLTTCFAKETCQSPKQDVFNRLKSDTTLNIDIVNRFKYCEGKPMFRVSDEDKGHTGPRARGVCIVCKKRTNWYCILCRNWACHNKSDLTIKHIIDANTDSTGHRITAVNSCFVHCHPNYL